MIVWLLFVLALAALLMLGVEWLLRRLGIRRVDPDGAPTGLSEFLRLVRERRARRDPRDRSD